MTPLRRRREPINWIVEPVTAKEFAELKARVEKLESSVAELTDWVRGIDERVTDLEEG
jgi:hypothetical protein